MLKLLIMMTFIKNEPIFVKPTLPCYDVSNMMIILNWVYWLFSDFNHHVVTSAHLHYVRFEYAMVHTVTTIVQEIKALG